MKYFNKIRTSGANILVVDDTPENLQLLVRILKEMDYQVRPASNGPNALAGVKAEPPDLILLDIKMPDMSGYEVCKQLKSDEHTQDIPVIFTSALNEVIDKVKAFSVGGVDFITKPFQAEEVLARVQTHLYLRYLQKQLEAQNENLHKEIAERRQAEADLQQLNDELDQKVRANASLRSEADVSSALVQVSKKLLSADHDIDKIVSLILDCAKKLTQSEHGYVSAVDTKTSNNIAYTFTDMKPDQCKVENQDIVFQSGSEGKYKALWKHSLYTEPFYTNEPGSHFAPDGHIPLHGFLCVPVKTKEQSAGQITIANPAKNYEDKDLDIIERLGELYTLAIQHQQYEKNKEKLQSQLRQAQKLESIGVLAGGIAHDFNNILFPMIGFLEMMLDDIPGDSPLYDRLNKVLAGAKRASDLVRQILTFSRESANDPRPLKIQSIIKEVSNLIQSTLPATIEIRQYADSNCAPVMADPTHIHQVIMNLVTNAYHAMQEKGGMLEISLKETDLEFDDLKDLGMKPGPYVCLSVSDTGMGMDRAVSEKIFDPYFTTKEKGKGTGLGLAVVHGIVRTCGGDIRVYSEPGKGSVFHVYLPSIKTGTGWLAPETTAPISTGDEHILLVDNENEIVEMGQQLLERLGYQVTSRTSSIEAMEAFRANPDRFDLVITDLTMPNMTGFQLSQKLLEIRPGIPIVLCTGFSEQITEETAKAMGIREYVMKPLVKSELAKIIRKVLDGD